MNNKKISLAEKIRRQQQAKDKTKYLDGNGGFITMTKTKDGYEIETCNPN